jgi:hypothetical protein
VACVCACACTARLSLSTCATALIHISNCTSPDICTKWCTLLWCAGLTAIQAGTALCLPHKQQAVQATAVQTLSRHGVSPPTTVNNTVTTHKLSRANRGTLSYPPHTVNIPAPLSDVHTPVIHIPCSTGYPALTAAGRQQQSKQASAEHQSLQMR